MQEKTNVTLYKCDYCSKFLQVKSAMIKHEKKCGKNPENINFCSGCKHLEEIDSFYLVGQNDSRGYNEKEVKCKGFYCTHYEKELFPRNVITRGLLEKYPETFDEKEPMPSEIQGCENYDLGIFDLGIRI